MIVPVLWKPIRANEHKVKTTPKKEPKIKFVTFPQRARRDWRRYPFLLERGGAVMHPVTKEQDKLVKELKTSLKGSDFIFIEEN